MRSKRWVFGVSLRIVWLKLKMLGWKRREERECRQWRYEGSGFRPQGADLDWLPVSPSILKAIGRAGHLRRSAFQVRRGKRSFGSERDTIVFAVPGRSSAQNSTKNRAKLERPSFPRKVWSQPACWSPSPLRSVTLKMRHCAFLLVPLTRTKEFNESVRFI